MSASRSSLDGAAQRSRHPGLPCGQRPQHLNHEQRVAASALQDCVGQPWVPGLAGQLRDRLRAERSHVDPGGHRREHRADLLVVLGPDGHHDEQPRAGQVTSEVVNELDRGLPRVLQVVHDDQYRVAGGEPVQEGGHRLEGAAPFGVGGASPGRRGAEQRRGLGQQGRGRGCMLAEQLPQGARGHTADHRRHRLHDRLQEQRSFGLVAARPQHGRAGHFSLGREILGEGRLADPGLPDDHDQARIPGYGAAPGLAQRSRLGISACQHRTAAGRPCGTGRPDGASRCPAACRQPILLLAQDRQVQFVRQRHPARARPESTGAACSR
jgi:hypothetical protein